MPIGLVIGGQELLLIVLAIGLLFGATRIPQFMRGLGQGIKEFKGAVKDDGSGAPASSAPAPQPPESPENTTQAG